MLVFSSTFLFAQEYWEFSVNGKYPDGKKLIQTNYNASSNLWESNVNSAYISLSDFIIDASISRDHSGLDWIYSEVPKIVSRLDQMEGDAAFYSYRLLVLLDLSKLYDARYSQKSRLDLINSHKNISYHALSPNEYIFGCNAKLDLFLFEIKAMASAEQTLVSCLGNLVLYNDITPTLALSFSSRVAYSRAVLKRNHGRDILVSALDQLLLGEFLQIKTPILIDAIGILSMTSTLIETNFTQTAYNFLVSQKQQSTYIPDRIATQIEAAHDFNLAKLGLPKSQPVAKVFEPLNIFHDKVRAVSKITDRSKKSRFLLDKKANMPGEATLDRLLELSLNKTSEKDVTNILNILGKSFSDSKKDDRTYLTHEKNSSLWDHFIFEKLLDQLSSFSSSEQSKYKFDRDISASLFSMAFSINKTADFSNRLSLNDALYDQKLDAVAKIYLKLSRQLDLKFVELVELLIEKSIDYASRNFEYKEMDKITRGDAGDHAYDFLVNYRYLGRSIEQFQKITLAELSKSNENYDLPVEIVQKSLSSGQVVIAYKHFGENIFRCIIEHQNFNCHASKATSFSESKYELQGLIRDKQEVDRALSNSHLSKLLLSEVDFNSAKEIMFHIPRSDYDLPINVLLDNEGDYIGLKYDISVLPSILPKRIKQNTLEKQMEGYIAFADPEYSTNINVDLQGSDFFKIRSAEQIKELQSLSPLPETQKEITEVAKFFSDRNKKLLLGKSASELNFRLTDFTNYDFLHFAVHGLVSGNFSGLREPALALSVPDKVYSRMNDGLLTESEISEFDFTGKHIFLSACKTAADFGAQVNSGFEGIASAFLLAGAAEVFATQWDIESLSAVDIVTQYLENFTIKEQNASGLKSALYAYVKKTNQPPYFWAPYLRFKTLNQIKSPSVAQLEMQLVSEAIYNDKYKNIFNQIFDVNGVVYATGYLDNIKLKKTNTFIQNLETGEKHIFQDDVSIFSLVGFSKKGNNPILYGATRSRTKVTPALFIMSVETFEIEILYELDISLIPGASTISIESLNFVDENNFQMVVRGYLSPDELEKFDGKKKNTELANRPHLIDFQGGSENIKSQELPNSSQGYSFITSLFGNSENTSALNFKYEFRDGKLYAFEELRNMELNEKFDSEEGLLECNPSKIFTRVYSVNLKDISFTQVMNFDGVASGNFITETCSGTHPFSIKRLDFEEKSVSEPLPVTIGYPTAISLKVSEHHKLHVGILAMPASFEKERIHVYRTAMDALYNREIFAAPGEQSLFFILSERDAILTNAYLQLFRTNSAINDAVLINGDLYLTGSFSSERSKIFKISKSAIETIQ